MDTAFWSRAGRSPRTDGLALDMAGVHADDRGFILTDAGQKSTDPKVSAAVLR